MLLNTGQRRLLTPSLCGRVQDGGVMKDGLKANAPSLKKKEKMSPSHRVLLTVESHVHQCLISQSIQKECWESAWLKIPTLAFFSSHRHWHTFIFFSAIYFGYNPRKEGVVSHNHPDGNVQVPGDKWKSHNIARLRRWHDPFHPDGQARNQIDAPVIPRRQTKAVKHMATEAVNYMATEALCIEITDKSAHTRLNILTDSFPLKIKYKVSPP